MDEAELIIIGAAFAAAVALTETKFHDVLRRVLLSLSVVVGAGLLLLLLGLSMSQDPWDFLAADFGVVIVVGVFGVGGLLPRHS